MRKIKGKEEKLENDKNGGNTKKKKTYIKSLSFNRLVSFSHRHTQTHTHTQTPTETLKKTSKPRYLSVCPLPCLSLRFYLRLASLQILCKTQRNSSSLGKTCVFTFLFTCSCFFSIFIWLKVSASFFLPQLLPCCRDRRERLKKVWKNR